MPRPATIGGKYVLMRPIAIGGMSEVFLARQTGLQGFEKLVVIKRILPHLAEEQRFVDMLLDEARTAADLRHPNVVNVFEVGEDQGTWFIAMEYLHGRTVRDLLLLSGKGQPLPLPHALQIVLDAATGLGYAHQKMSLKGEALRIVHRDVKPGNLIVTFEGMTKVLDFGIAKARLRSRETEAGHVTGTAAYMSPEQALGEKIDHRSDQFSLGAVLYELTTGHALFKDKNDLESMKRVVSCQVTPPEEIRPDYPEELSRIVIKTLARRPADRYASCAELTEELLSFLENAGIAHGHLRVARYLSELIPETDSFAERPAPGADLNPTQTRTDASGLAGAGPAWVVRGGGGTDQDAPAQSTSEPERRTNLVPNPALFVGRVKDLDALGELLDAGARLVTLLGPGGAGKTRLASRFGQIALRDERFESVWFCDLSSARSLADVLSVVGGVLGVPLTASVDEHAAVELLGRAIEGRGNTLLILDNFEQIIELGPSSVGVWMGAAAEATFLVTSRELLKLPGEVPREVGPLSLPDGSNTPMRSEAVQLFVDRARSVRAGYSLSEDDVDPVARIVEQLDGLPLAIELAAARMGVFRPAELLERMPERFAVLRGSRRDAETRQQTLQAAIDWSWSALEPWEQTALAQAGVFRGGFSLSAAEYVLDLSGHPEAPWVADVVQSLCDKSLLRRFEAGGTLRFGMYESIRAYALKRAEEAELLEGAAGRHGDYYVQICGDLAARVYTHGGRARLQALTLERDNLLAVLERSRESSDGAHALEAALALDPVFGTAGPLQTHLDGLTGALDVAATDDEVPAELLVRGLEARGRARRAMGQTEASGQDFERALSLARESGSRRLEGRILRYLGTLLQLRGRVEEAADHYQRALEIHRELSDRRFEGLSLGSLAVLDMELGRLEEAARHFLAAVEILREVGDEASEGIYHGNLGAVHQLQGEARAARTHYQQALEVHRRVGNRRFEGMVLGYLGSLLHDKGALDEARADYESALRVLREVGDRRFEGMFLGYVGVVLQETDAPEAAAEHYDRALHILRKVGDRRLEGLFLGFRGGLHAQLNQIEEATRALEEADKLTRGSGDPSLVHTVEVNRGHLDLAMARRAAARGDLQEQQKAAEAAQLRIAEAQSRLPPSDEHPQGLPAPAETSDDIRFALRVLNHALQHDDDRV